MTGVWLIFFKTQIKLNNGNIGINDDNNIERMKNKNLKNSKRKRRKKKIVFLNSRLIERGLCVIMNLCLLAYKLTIFSIILLKIRTSIKVSYWWMSWIVQVDDVMYFLMKILLYTLCRQIYVLLFFSFYFLTTLTYVYQYWINWLFGGSLFFIFSHIFISFSLTY